jgi:hypothetical protein
MTPDQILALSSEMDLWKISFDSSDILERYRCGSLAFWHACRIIVWRNGMNVTMGHADVQSAAMEILRLCTAAGDKVEYMNWVSIGISISISISASTSVNFHLNQITQGKS